MKPSYLVTKGQKLSAVLMIMKQNLSYSAAGPMFCVDRTTVSEWFDEVIKLTSDLSKYGIVWWSKEQIQAKMPEVCKQEAPDLRVYIGNSSSFHRN